jgi:alpha-amylase
MPDICLGFEVHQPYRINREFRRELSRGKKIDELFEIYFDNEWNKTILERVARKCYLPANKIVLENINAFKQAWKRFKVTYSISGVLIEQLEHWAPEVLDSFKKLADSECVEFLSQTYYHSLSSLFSSSRKEFIEQVVLHKHLMKSVFGCDPKVFENTEFVYNNSIAKTLEQMGYLGVFTEGAERILHWRSPNYVYKAAKAILAVLLRNYKLSDDIAFRFSARDWVGWPLTADKYAAWLSATPGQCVNIFVDYETFGEHQWPETGVLDFLKWLPKEILKHENLQFKTPSELINTYTPVGEIDVQDFNTISWADAERSTNAWLGNDMQRTCYNALKKMEPYVKDVHNEKILKLWRLLQTSDLIYYMYAQPDASGLVHGYFSLQPPAKVFWGFTRILSDLYWKVADHLDEHKSTAARLLRIVPPDEAFQFHENGSYIQLSAHSLDEFKQALLCASDRSILYHTARKDFEKWIRYTIGDSELADTIRKMRRLSVEEFRNDLFNSVSQRLLRLESEETEMPSLSQEKRDK